MLGNGTNHLLTDLDQKPMPKIVEAKHYRVKA